MLSPYRPDCIFLSLYCRKNWSNQNSDEKEKIQSAIKTLDNDYFLSQKDFKKALSLLGLEQFYCGDIKFFDKVGSMDDLEYVQDILANFVYVTVSSFRKSYFNENYGNSDNGFELFSSKLCESKITSNFLSEMCPSDSPIPDPINDSILIPSLVEYIMASFCYTFNDNISSQTEIIKLFLTEENRHETKIRENYRKIDDFYNMVYDFPFIPDIFDEKNNTFQYKRTKFNSYSKYILSALFSSSDSKCNPYSKKYLSAIEENVTIYEPKQFNRLIDKINKLLVHNHDSSVSLDNYYKYKLLELVTNRRLIGTLLFSCDNFNEKISSQLRNKFIIRLGKFIQYLSILPLPKLRTYLLEDFNTWEGEYPDWYFDFLTDFLNAFIFNFLPALDNVSKKIFGNYCEKEVFLKKFALLLTTKYYKPKRHSEIQPLSNHILNFQKKAIDKNILLYFFNAYQSLQPKRKLLQ